MSPLRSNRRLIVFGIVVIFTIRVRKDKTIVIHGLPSCMSLTSCVIEFCFAVHLTNIATIFNEVAIKLSVYPPLSATHFGKYSDDRSADLLLIGIRYTLDRSAGLVFVIVDTAALE